MSDKVNHPDHYTQGGIECIDAIRAALGPEFQDYCIGNVLKYVWRCKHKNGIEDLRKAMVYLNWAIDAAVALDVEQPASNAPESPAVVKNPSYCMNCEHFSKGQWCKKHEQVTMSFGICGDWEKRTHSNSSKTSNSSLQVGDEVEITTPEHRYFGRRGLIRFIGNGAAKNFIVNVECQDGGWRCTWIAMEDLTKIDPPTEPQYREPVEVDIDKEIEVRQLLSDDWSTRVLWSVEPLSEHRFVCKDPDDALDVIGWKYARIKVGGEA